MERATSDMESQEKVNSFWLDRPLASILPKWNVETLLVLIILVAAIFSRFYLVGLRVMSHDEINHVVPSYNFYQGEAYRHDPVTHGPLQFHLVALSYFLLGDSDFSSRVPAALFSVAAVAAVLFLYRRYLGRSGALIAGFLFLISPFMLFYGRYTRNEAFIELFGVLILYGVLRYLDKGDKFSLFLLTAVTALNFTTKETAYIYTAQLLLFVGVLFLEDVARARWKDVRSRDRFLTLMVVALTLFMLALGFAAWNASVSGGEETAPAATVENPLEMPVGGFSPQFTLEVVALMAALGVAVVALVLLIRSLGWKEIRKQRSFDILVLIGTLVLPLLTAFPVKIVGWNPLDYGTSGLIRTGFFIVLLMGVSITIGLWWKRNLWIANALLFFGIFTVFYTTVFTNGEGFFSGLVGALGYWLEQQGVERGSQPLYYYALIEIPIYEYLAALGTLLAVYFGVRYRRFMTLAGFSPALQPETEGLLPAGLEKDRSGEVELKGETDPQSEVEPVSGIEPEEKPAWPRKVPTLSLLVYWSITSLIAYSVAGERMPWLTVHIALPLLLTAGWGFGYLVDSINWKRLFNQKGVLTLVLLPIFVTSLAMTLSSLLGTQAPFQGNTVEQLRATSTFLLAAISCVASGGGIVYLQKDWQSAETLRLLSVAFIGLLALLTIRTSYRASFINYDNAKEYLVYAHAARGPKDILEQVEEISRRITGGKDIKVAYDNDGLYPYWWYFRDYPNHLWYTDKPTRELQDYPLIIASDTNAGKLEPIIKDNYVSFDYARLWWPNQDYFNLTWERIWNAISDRKMRSAIFDIWLNRDYTLYAELTNNPNLTIETWQPSSRFKFFIRKDVVSQMWDYGASPVAIEDLIVTDPYEGGEVMLMPDQIVGTFGVEPGQLQNPRGLAAAPDGSVYVADSRNHRIQHFSSNGELIDVWGSFADATADPSVDPSVLAPGGTFNEPWGIVVGPDGSVYVADTWNHRIQKFTADGKFITMWGYFGQAERPEAFWGPRDVAVDSKGPVFVTDTWNKRIVVFDENGNYITQFGQAGIELGDLDEPVGLTVDAEDHLFVADTWNKRVEQFVAVPEEQNFIAVQEFEVYGWFGESLENKPYIAVDAAGNIYVTDPEGYRVIAFDAAGNFLRYWGQYSTEIDGFGLPSGIAVDPEGHVWVSDGENNRLLRFTMP